MTTSNAFGIIPEDDAAGAWLAVRLCCGKNEPKSGLAKPEAGNTLAIVAATPNFLFGTSISCKASFPGTCNCCNFAARLDLLLCCFGRVAFRTSSPVSRTCWMSCKAASAMVGATSMSMRILDESAVMTRVAATSAGIVAPCGGRSVDAAAVDSAGEEVVVGSADTVAGVIEGGTTSSGDVSSAGKVDSTAV